MTTYTTDHIYYLAALTLTPTLSLSLIISGVVCFVKYVLLCVAMKGLVGIVTGAASGLGRATAERFVREGAKIVLCDLPQSAGQEVADQLGDSAVFSPTDVRAFLCYS